jgi:VanW family protein
MGIGVSPNKKENTLFENVNNNITDKDYKIPIVLIAIILTIITLVIIYFWVNKKENNREKYYSNNITINGMSISNLSSKSELKTFLDGIYLKRLKEQAVFRVEDKELRIKGEDIDIKYNIDDIIDDIEKKNSEIKEKQSNFQKYDFQIQFEYEKENLENIYEKVNLELKGNSKKIVEFNFEKMEAKLNKNTNEKSLDKIEFNNKVLNKFKEINNYEQIDTLPVLNVISSSMQFEEIYNFMVKEPKDAYLNKNNENMSEIIVKEENGYKPEKSIEELREIYLKAEDFILVKLKRVDAKITEKMLKENNRILKNQEVGNEIIYDKVIKFTENMDENSKVNIKIASNDLNGTIVDSEQVFSFNDTLGKRTKNRGFVNAPMYSNNGVSNEIGGGISFVASGIYEGILRAGYEIKERLPHRYTVEYKEPGLDSAIYSGTYDLKFKNNTPNRLKIETINQNDGVRFRLIGKKENNKKVEINIEKKETEKFTTKYLPTNSLKDGEKKIIQIGRNGYISYVYRKIYINNELKENSLISKDNYQMLPEIVSVGANKDYIDLD